MENELHEKAKAAANEYQNCEIKLIQILKEIDTSKVFLRMGYSSLFTYITEALNLSEAVAYNLSTVVRKSKEVPELQAAIENGLALSKARKIVPVLTKENSGVWLEKAKTLPKADLEREVAAVSPYVTKRESVRAVSIDRYSLKLEISLKLKRELARAQTLESNRKKKSVNFEEMLEGVVKFYLEHRDPLVRAERIVAKKNISNQNSPKKRPPSIGSFSWGRGSETGGVVTVARKPIARKIPASIFHQVQIRDGGRCTYKSPEGKICENSRGLEVHHRKPWAVGGTHEISNLQLLCASHHHFRHEIL
jgi:5-methylcytosine-specific restriction endonuclease McrA